MYDVRDARKFQFPFFANVDDQRLLAAIASRLELDHRNLVNHAGQNSNDSGRLALSSASMAVSNSPVLLQAVSLARVTSKASCN